MSYSIYIGDIDPNNNVDPVKHVRRNILFKLLLWDSIVLSDSQFLTDPRIAMMMDGFSERKMGEHNLWDDMSGWHKGFEKLMESGMIEVAHRKDFYGERYSMLDVWNAMNNNKSAKVPFLPPTSAYAEFLDKIFYHKREYDLKSMSERFKNNLHIGVSSGTLILSETDDIDREITKLLCMDVVLFRDILKLIKEALSSGKITEQRYNEIYQYVYSCYHTNIPAEIGCSVCTNYENLPLHLDLGYDTDEKSPEIDDSLVRPTWALDPVILDLLPTDSFIRVRQSIEPHLKKELLIKQKNGELLPEDTQDFYDLWEDYTIRLESALKAELLSLYSNIDDIISNQFVSSQKKFKNGIMELVFNVVKSVTSALVPGAGLILDLAEYGKLGIEGINNYIMLNNKREMDYLLQQKKDVFAYINKCMYGATVITKYKK